MDRPTVDVYERRIDDYLRRRLTPSPGAAALGARVTEGRLRLDLGSGPGHMTAALGEPVVAIDAARSMISGVDATPLRVQADLEALPLRRGAVHGTWASKCLQHVPAERLPLALGDLHRTMAVGAPLSLVVFAGEGVVTTGDATDLPGRRFWLWSPRRLADVLEGAGFTDVVVQEVPRHGQFTELHASAVRGRSLSDVVGPGMTMLVCGLNPSLYAADAGVAFARPGNRFWPALRAAGLCTVDRDPPALLRLHGIGSTDLVKRATVAAGELGPDEFAAGIGRVERLCEWLTPGVVYLVGLQGWRTVVDRKARPGVQERTFGGAPVYVGPSTSGLNASTQLAGHAAHLRTAMALGTGRIPPPAPPPA